MYCIYIYRISDVTRINCVPIPLLKKSTSTNPTRVWAAEMSWSTIGGVADGDAWRRMATHWGRLFHGTGLWSWGSPECFPKSVMISWYFMWLPPFSTQSFEHRKIIWGTWWIFRSFFRCPKLRNWPPDATAIEKNGGEPPSGLRGVCQCQRCCQKDAWEMTILYL